MGDINFIRNMDVMDVKNIPFFILNSLMWWNGALFIHSSDYSIEDYFYSKTSMERNPSFHKCRVIFSILL